MKERGLARRWQQIETDERRRLMLLGSRADLRLIPGLLGVWLVALLSSAAVTWLPWVLALVVVLLSLLLMLPLRFRAVLWRRGAFLILGVALSGLCAAAQLLLAAQPGAQDFAAATARQESVQLLLRVQSTPQRATFLGAGVEHAARGNPEPSDTQLENTRVEKARRTEGEPTARAAITDACAVSCSAEVSILAIRATGQWWPGPRALAHLRLSCSSCRDLALGQELRIWARVSPGDEFAQRPRLSALGPPTLTRLPGPLAEVASELRAAFMGQLNSGSEPSGPVRQLLAGMVIGERGAPEPRFATTMASTGLTHLIAVSGANCVILLSAVLLLLRSLRMPRLPAALAAVAVLPGFVLVVGPEPSVTRAAWMCATTFLGLAVGQAAGGLSALTACGTVLLCTDPYLCAEAGFILSMLATAGIIIGAVPLARWLARILPAPLALIIAVPCAAQLACQPVVVLFNPQFTPFAVLANALVAPLVPVVTLSGMLVLLSAPLAPWLSGAALWLAELAAGMIWWLAESVAQWPGAASPWPQGPWGLTTMLAFGLTGLLVLALLANAVRVMESLARMHHWLTDWFLGHDTMKRHRGLNKVGRKRPSRDPPSERAGPAPPTP